MKENEVIQLLCHLHTADDFPVLGQLLRGRQQRLILIAGRRNEGRKAEEGARVVLLAHTRRCGDEVNQPIIAGDLQDVAEGGHQHVAGGGREVRALPYQVLYEQLPIAALFDFQVGA
ncbi:MAG: hypothetical protein B7Y80_19560 [Hyphomicrobium sp. 32-62-53]|nr:MAG: hypothetical protein B7Z29_19755 [Hyphomicrobium sp. 12-62-95]OYX97462.1 MAG: hypothetical protein B7Y80_19560 [Hyphomicrobium sp. 32-62-53]